MNITSQTAWWLTLLISAILFIGIIGYSTYSIMRAMRGIDQPKAVIPAPAIQAPTTAPATLNFQNTPMAPTTPSSSREATPAETSPPAVKAAPPAASGTSDISKEFEIMRQKEESHKEMIKALRKQAQEHPDAENTPSKEEIDKLEKSGASIM